MIDFPIHCLCLFKISTVNTLHTWCAVRVKRNRNRDVILYSIINHLSHNRAVKHLSLPLQCFVFSSFSPLWMLSTSANIFRWQLKSNPVTQDLYMVTIVPLQSKLGRVMRNSSSVPLDCAILPYNKVITTYIHLNSLSCIKYYMLPIISLSPVCKVKYYTTT